MNNGKPPSWPELFLVIVTPVIGMAMGIGITIVFGLNQTNINNLIVNLFFLLACIVLIRIFKFSLEDMGLKLIKSQIKNHVLLSLGISTFYILFYIFVIRISGLRPLSLGAFWSLLTYLIVVIAEELFFRGILYGFIQERFSSRIALIATSIIFGLFHASQGLRGIVSKTFTGWLWGSVRYSTGMIFLLILLIHFAYNSIWLLFEGNWNNPPTWAIFALPALEFLLGLAIFIIHDKQSENV